MNKRFSELTVSATDFANDDVIAIDGETNGTRKMSGSALKSAMKSNTLATADSNAYVVSDGDVVRIKDLPTSITDFRDGDVILVDGPDGTAKMSKDDLLRETAENAATADPVLSAIVNIYVNKGSASVAYLNAHAYIVGLKAGWVYTAKNDGSVTDHSSDWDGNMTAGEQVVWDGSVWKKYFSESIFARKTDLEKKVDVNIGANICDPSKVIDGVYNGSAYNASSSYKTSDYIPVNASNITAKYYTKSTVFSSITVFDENKQFLRGIKSSGSYTYTIGDAFIRVSWMKASSDINYISYGNEATTKEYSTIGGYVEGKFLQIGQGVLEDVENGVYVQMQNQSDLSASSKKTIISPTEFTITNKGTGAWLTMPDLPFDGSKYHVSFTAENLTKEIYPSSECTIYVANGTNSATSGQYSSLGNFQDGTFDFVFEPQYYAAHMGWDKIRVWLRYDNGNGTDDKIWDFKDFQVYKRNGELQTDVISGSNAKELFESTDSSLSQLKSAVDQFSVTLKDPNGNAYELAIDSDGNIVKFPIVPTKAHFFGNSLLTSNGSAEGIYGKFGMNATDHNLDYASRFETCVLTLNHSYVYERDANSGFEDLTTSDPAKVNPLIQTNYLDKLDGDEDFVCVQLGDNGNDQAVAVLGANVETLLRAIRTKCSSARVVVFGMWYSSTAKQTALFNAATNTGCKYISMSGIRSSETESFYGAVINEGYTGNWTVDNVVSVTENTATNITVVFTAGGSNHTATIDVDSYSQTGTTLSYSGQQKITINGGVASHPGNEGFRLLANRLLFELGIVSTDEYFQS